MEKKYNSDQWWINDKCWCKCKKRYVCEKDYVWNPATCGCENGKYLASIMDDSAIMCDEVIKPCDVETKKVLKNFKEKILTCRTQNSYILYVFLWIK